MDEKDDISCALESGQPAIHNDEDIAHVQSWSQTAGELIRETMEARSADQGSIQNPRIDSSGMQPSMYDEKRHSDENIR